MEKKMITITMRKNFPDVAVTRLCNLMGDKFINCVKNEKGKWEITYEDVPVENDE